jgi:signal transduction histidine kinase
VQELTDAELAVRSYLLGATPERLARWQAARDNLPGVQAAALRLTTQVEPGVSRQLEALLGKLQARSARLGQWMTLAQQGRNAEALVLAAKDLPGEPLSVLRAEFDHILDQAASAQRVVRVSLYDAMMLSRLAVHLLAMLSVVALAQCLRSLRVRDSELAQEKGRLESQRLIRTAELRQLAGHLVSAREDEPARVAKDLHDEMGGLFTAMKLALARLKRLEGLPGLALDRVKGVEARLNEGVALKRRIIENRRPSSLDPLGLRAALELLCQDVAQQSSLKGEVVVEDLPLDKALELTLYRLVQESLTNTVKNAQAAHRGCAAAGTGWPGRPGGAGRRAGF